MIELPQTPAALRCPMVNAPGDRRSIGDPLLDAVLDYGQAEATAAVAAATGDAERARQASAESTLLLGQIIELHEAQEAMEGRP